MVNKDVWWILDVLCILSLVTAQDTSLRGLVTSFSTFDAFISIHRPNTTQGRQKAPSRTLE